MVCSGCKQEAYQIHGEFVGVDYIEHCDRCGEVSGMDASIPDVYWPGREHTNPQLCDSMGVPYKLTSKAQKARVMKELGVSEVGDKVRGAAYTGQSNWVDGTRAYRKRNFEQDRPKLQKIYQQWKEKHR
jgi:hypothetical protein